MKRKIRVSIVLLVLLASVYCKKGVKLDINDLSAVPSDVRAEFKQAYDIHSGMLKKSWFFAKTSTQGGDKGNVYFALIVHDGDEYRYNGKFIPESEVRGKITSILDNGITVETIEILGGEKQQ